LGVAGFVGDRWGQRTGYRARRNRPATFCPAPRGDHPPGYSVRVAPGRGDHASPNDLPTMSGGLPRGGDPPSGPIIVRWRDALQPCDRHLQSRGRCHRRLAMPRLWPRVGPNGRVIIRLSHLQLNLAVLRRSRAGRRRTTGGGGCPRACFNRATAGKEVVAVLEVAARDKARRESNGDQPEPNPPLQPTAAARLVPRSSLARSAAAAAELFVRGAGALRWHGSGA